MSCLSSLLPWRPKKDRAHHTEKRRCTCLHQNEGSASCHLQSAGVLPLVCCWVCRFPLLCCCRFADAIPTLQPHQLRCGPLPKLVLVPPGVAGGFCFICRFPGPVMYQYQSIFSFKRSLLFGPRKCPSWRWTCIISKICIRMLITLLDWRKGAHTGNIWGWVHRLSM